MLCDQISKKLFRNLKTFYYRPQYDTAVFAGGSLCLENSSTVDVKTWDGLGSIGTALSTIRHSLAAASADDKVIFAGGVDSSIVDTVDIRDISGMGFTGSSLSQACMNFAGAATQGKAIFFGGITSTAPINTINVIDSIGVATTIANTKQARYDLAGATALNTAIFAGGSNGSGANASVTIINSDMTVGDGTDLTEISSTLASSSIDNQALFIGGFSGASVLQLADFYDYTGTKTTVTVSSFRRFRLAGARSNNNAIFAGGYDQSSNPTNIVQKWTGTVVSASTTLTTSKGDLSGATAWTKALFAGGSTAYSADNNSMSDTLDIRDLNGGSTGTSLTQAKYKLAAGNAKQFQQVENTSDDPLNNQFQRAIFAGGLIQLTNNNDTVDVRNNLAIGSTGTVLSSARQQIPRAGAGINAVFVSGSYSNLIVDVRDVFGDGFAVSGVIGREQSSGASAGDKGIFAGGYSNGNLSTVEVISQEGLKSSGMNLPIEKQGISGATAYDRAVFVGGRNSSGYLSDVDVRDSNGNGTTGISLLSTRIYIGFSSAGNKAVFVGGNDDQGTRYNLTEIRDRYGIGIVGIALSEARTTPSGTKADQYAVFAGGLNSSFNDSNTVDLIDQYGIKISSQTMSTSRHDIAAATAYDKAIFAGGEPYTNLCFSIGDNGTISNGTNLSVTKSRVAGASARQAPLFDSNTEGRAFFAGGRQSTSASDIYSTVDIRDDNGVAFTGDNLSTPTYNNTGASAGGNAIFVGGNNQTSNFKSNVEVYKYNGTKFNGTNLPNAKSNLGGATAQNMAVFAGGYYYEVSGLNNGPQKSVDLRDKDGLGFSGTELDTGGYDIVGGSSNNYAIFKHEHDSQLIYAYDPIGLKSTGIDLPLAGIYSAGSTADNKVIFAGLVFSPPPIQDFVCARDINSGTTGLKISMPFNQGSSSAKENAIFAGGDSPSSDKISSTVDVRNSNANGFSGTSLPTAKRIAISASTGNKAIFAGGSDIPPNQNIPFDTVDLIDKFGKGSSGTKLPIAKQSHAGAGAKQDNPYIGQMIGGAIFAGGNSNRLFEEYHLDEVVVRDRNGLGYDGTQLTDPKVMLAGASTGTNAIFTGGYTTAFTYNSTDIRNLTGLGSNGQTLSTSRHSLGAATAKDRAVFAGGRNGSTDLNIVDLFDSTGVIITGTTLSVARRLSGGASSGNNALFGGGVAGNTGSSTLDVITPTGTSYTGTSLTSPTDNNDRQSAATSGMAVFACSDGNNRRIDLRDPDGNGYTASNQVPEATYLYGSATSVEDRAIFLFGQNCMKYLVVQPSGTIATSIQLNEIQGLAAAGATAKDRALFYGGTNLSLPYDYKKTYSILRLVNKYGLSSASLELNKMARDHLAGAGVNPPVYTTGINAIFLGGRGSAGTPTKLVQGRSESGQTINGTNLTKANVESSPGATSKSMTIFAGGAGDSSGLARAEVYLFNSALGRSDGTNLPDVRQEISGATAGNHLSSRAVFAGGRGASTFPLNTSVLLYGENGNSITGTNLSEGRNIMGAAQAGIREYGGPAIFFGGYSSESGIGVYFSTIDQFDEAGLKSTSMATGYPSGSYAMASGSTKNHAVFVGGNAGTAMFGVDYALCFGNGTNVSISLQSGTGPAANTCAGANAFESAILAGGMVGNIMQGVRNSYMFDSLLIMSTGTLLATGKYNHRAATAGRSVVFGCGNTSNTANSQACDIIKYDGTAITGVEFNTATRSIQGACGTFSVS